MQTPHILAIDDKENTLILLNDVLSGQGYTITTATNGQDALSIMDTNPPDLILLDIMMPLMDGYQFITRVRRISSVPIIMLTAKRHEHDVVRGFELGADDYITKPYRMRILLMRIRAVMRRSQQSQEAGISSEVIAGSITLNKQNLRVTVREKPVDLTPIEFRLLELLIDSVDIPVHRATLCTRLTEHGFSGSEQTLKIHIRNLRQKIEPDPTSPIYIETVFGIGYRLQVIP